MKSIRYALDTSAGTAHVTFTAKPNGYGELEWEGSEAAVEEARESFREAVGPRGEVGLDAVTEEELRFRMEGPEMMLLTPTLQD